ERDEQEAAPVLQRNREQAEFVGLKSGILLAVRNADQPSVPREAPRMIGTGQNLGTTALAVHETRTAVPAHVGEGTDLAIVAANDNDALAEIFERPPISRPRDLALVADDLRRGAQKGALLCLE